MSTKEYWNNEWVNKENISMNNYAKKVFRIIRNKKPKNMLDIGCGNGKDAVYFAKKGIKVTATDFSESGINLLKKDINTNKIKNIKPILTDIRKQNFKKNSYNVVYAHLSLHCFDDKETTKIFNEIYRIMKKNGLFFVKCKSTDDARFGVGIKIGENIWVKGTHIRHFFDKNYMKAKLAKFKILKIRKTSSKYHSYKSSFIEAVAMK
jgi:tellurite methyltransferase